MKWILLFLFSLLTFTLTAQFYSRSAGVRTGVSSGISYRFSPDTDRAFEGSLTIGHQGCRVLGMRQFFTPAVLRLSDNVYYSIGYGGHFGFTYTDHYRFLIFEYQYGKKKVSPVAGIDANLGIEYRVMDFPLVAGIEYRPFFEFSTRQVFNVSLAEISIVLRYCLP